MSDPITLARKREEEDRLPFIAVQEFRTEYKPQPDGTQLAYDVVAWVKKGAQNPSVTEEKVSRLQKDPQNLIWKVIGPLYARWKEGQSAPVEGTPLAAWPGATPALVKALDPANIRSVEDLARMEDSAMVRIGIPGIREKQKHARAYLDAQVSTAGVAAENVKLRETVENMSKRIDELQEALKSLEDEPEAPKRRGRPPKLQVAN